MVCGETILLKKNLTVTKTFQGKFCSRIEAKKKIEHNLKDLEGYETDFLRPIKSQFL